MALAFRLTIVLTSQLLLHCAVFGEEKTVSMVRQANDAVIIRPPSDRATTINSLATTLTCQMEGHLKPEQEFQWIKFEPGSVTTVIYSTKRDPPVANSEKYAIFGKYDLEIKNLVLQDGGNYQCLIKTGNHTQEAYGALLWTFDSPVPLADPLTDGIEGDIGCTCDFGTSAALLQLGQRPMLTMTIGSVVYHGTPTLTDIPNGFRLDVATRYIPKAIDNNQTYSCSVQVQSPSYIKSSEIKLDVRFSPRNITFHPHKQAYGIGEVIKCQAAANPLAAFRWVSVQSPVGDGFPINTDSLLITEHMANELMPTNNRWNCEANNVIGPTFTKEFDFVVDPSISSGWRPGSNVMMTSFTAVLFILNHIFMSN